MSQALPEDVQSWAPPQPTNAAKGGRHWPWWPGGGRPSSGGITGSHKACALVGTRFCDPVWYEGQR